MKSEKLAPEADSWSHLKPGGTLVSIAGESIQIPESITESHGIFFIVKPDRLQLIEISRLIDKGTLRPVIAGILPLAETARAFQKMMQPGKQRKYVLQVE